MLVWIAVVKYLCRDTVGGHVSQISECLSRSEKSRYGVLEDEQNLSVFNF
jgi:hypothetical protein